MIYVMSDIHGCYEEYLEALQIIHFNSQDILYVLGDVIDRGKEPIKLLQDMMLRENVIPIIGNHEYMAMTVLNRLCVEVNNENADKYLTMEDMLNYIHWISDGGQTTLQQFQKLSMDEKNDILEYLKEFSLYEEITVNGIKYLLLHAGLEPFDIDKPLKDYDISEVIFKPADYNHVYFNDCYLVTGHTPTIRIEPSLKGKIVKKNNHIAIDGGCVYGGYLTVYCLDTHQEWYIKSKQQKEIKK